MDETQNDPIKIAGDRMDNMSNKDLKILVFIAANRIGTILNNNVDYKDADEAVLRMCEGIELIFNAYDIAKMSSEAENTTH